MDASGDLLVVLGRIFYFTLRDQLLTKFFTSGYGLILSLLPLRMLFLDRYVRQMSHASLLGLLTKVLSGERLQ